MSSKSGFTEGEMRLLALVFQCAKDPKGIQIDFKKLAEAGGYKTTASANACWCALKKKLQARALSADTGNASADNADGASGDETTPAKPAPKKRAPKAKAKAVNDLENGAAADDEQTPRNSPKKSASTKRKAATTAGSESPQADVNDEPTEGVDAVTTIGNTTDAGNEEPPAKKKRTNNRKPKDENASPKKRGKKAAKSATPDGDDATANADDVNQAQTNGGETSLFGNGNIKAEEQNEDDRPFNAAEQQYVKERLADDKLFKSFVNTDKSS